MAVGLPAEVPPTSTPSLIALSLPQLDAVDSAVRATIEERWRAVTAASKRSDISPASLATLYAFLGNVLEVHELLDEGRIAYENARRLEPGNPKWIYFLGLVELEAAHLEEASVHFEKVLALQAEHLPSLLRLGRARLQLADLSRANARFRQAVILNPKSAAAHCGLGQIAQMNEDLEAAAKHLETCLEIQPHATRMHAALASIYRRLEKPERSREHAGLYGSGDVTFPDPWLAELRKSRSEIELSLEGARAAFKAGRYGVARREYERVLTADRSRTEAHKGLAAVLDRMGDTEGSIAHYRVAVRLEPRDPVSHFNLASLYSRLGSYELAREHFREVLRLDPGDSEAAANLALMLERTDNLRAALELYERLAVDRPGDASLQMRHGGALLRAGRHDDAAVAFGRVVSLQPEQLRAYQAQATALLLGNRNAEAKEQLEKGVTRLPGEIELSHSLARLLAACDDRSQRDGPRAVELALTVYEDAATPEHAETLTMAYAETGDFETAQRLQEAIVREAERRGDHEWTRRSQALLARYESGKTASLLAQGTDPGS